MARVVAAKGKKIAKEESVDVTPFVKAGKKVAAPVTATKKPAKSVLAAPATGTPAPPGIQDDGKAFTKEELSQLEILQLRMTTVQQTVELANRNLEAFVRDAQEKIKLAQADVSNKQAEAQRKAEELMALYRKLEEKYGIKMRDITYDPASGKIMTAPPGMLDGKS